ncbi:16S rRNA (guanine(527)-N(7))-methyltransferase RsmG [Paenibacillus filicis]|uniref:Ribosomal RNA small subunit methyltransferase G n=1 Tax=Paenibacillus gyeongsangnamensis TaxID=3388067 RepID=A0ABT4QKP1_9BACL|nr:16S rRNA (guanine(527)-N(7))-methyltransferase RsmG [Paenibacillus filicis]MCZ8517441.1 16S rRNA (guanine(527)-N(7))-methyltransferase RsmG [Paenibacillus filicis]
MDSVQQHFIELLAAKGMQLSQRQLEQFELYYRELVDWNERMNLTGITERDQVYVKHFYDSLSVAFFVPMNDIHTLADIGSGAGFPSIPLKIAFPHLQVTIIDSLNKRIQFLTHLCEALELPGVNCLHGRAEDVARMPAHRDRYDMVTARAVARLAVLNEFCLPFTRVGGQFVAMKGSEVEGELTEAAYSLKELKAKWQMTHRFQLPVEESTRHMLVIKKVGATPAKYPRKAGTPLKSPLV